MENNDRTSKTLMGRLRSNPTDPECWKKLTEVYGSLILGWSLRRNVPRQDSEGLVNEVFAKLAQYVGAMGKKREFEYDATKSFRALLKTLTMRTVADFFRQRRKAPEQLSEAGWAVAEETLAKSVERDLLESFDRQHEADLAAHAQSEAEAHFDERIWKAFCLTALEGQKGAQAAANLGMTVDAVFAAKSRVIKKIREICERLRKEEDAESA